MIKKLIRRILGKPEEEADPTKPVVFGPQEHGINPALISNNAIRVTQSLQEAGFKGFVLEPWFGIVAPIKTPAALVQRLNQAFDQALADPRLRSRLLDLDMVLVGGSPERLAQQIRLDSDRWGKLARSHGITADQ